MRDGVSVRVNLPDFRRELAALDARMQRRVLTRAVRAAGGVIQAAAKGLAPRLSTPRRDRVPGLLASRIAVRRSRFGRRGVIKFFVGVRGAKKTQRGRAQDPFYWKFLEGGWVPRGPGRKLAGGERSRALQRRRALSGGARRVQVPFLAPAFQRAAPTALAKFTSVVEAGVRELNGGAQ